MKLPLVFPRSPSQLLPKKLLKCQTRHISTFDIYTNSPIPPNKQRFVPTSGTYPKGFLIGSTSAGIKPAKKGQPDLVLVASEVPANAAAVFTKNAFPAPSITVSREILGKMQVNFGAARGVIVNSWCANLFTRENGLEDTWRMSKEADKFVSKDRNENGERNAEADSSVMVMHTGIGGTR
jgi:glutamate N-acetyltransferase/amino-acid N-acetyltransferase